MPLPGGTRRPGALGSTPPGRPGCEATGSNHRVVCAVSVHRSAHVTRPRTRSGPAQAECVVEQMRNLAGDSGCLAVAGDVVTLQAPWAVPPATTARQGSYVARLRTADREAAEELFNACYPRLAGWVRRLVDDDETAHEIAAEAFTRLLSRWSGLDNPQSYLYMIAT